jgi:hypothetical protein
MKKIIINIVNKILSVIFPHKELDPRPEYGFTNESWLNTISRNGNIEKYKTYKL